jgi:hypothetical protein
VIRSALEELLVPAGAVALHAIGLVPDVLPLRRIEGARVGHGEVERTHQPLPTGRPKVVPLLGGNDSCSRMPTMFRVVGPWWLTLAAEGAKLLR